MLQFSLQTKIAEINFYNKQPLSRNRVFSFDDDHLRKLEDNKEKLHQRFFTSRQALIVSYF